MFKKPLLSAHYENEDVQISAELCSNIAIRVIGLAKGVFTILSGNDDMVRIHTSVQAKESILKNAAALDPYQDGNQYTYTIHTPTEYKLERSVAFQVFVTIPRHLDSLASFEIDGTNIEVSIGNIDHTFINMLKIRSVHGDILIDSFYGETANITSESTGAIVGKYNVARLQVMATSGKIVSNVHLLNTDDDCPAPKVICSTANHKIELEVDGSDLFGQFAVEAKTQCATLDAKVLLASPTQKLLGNFINFGGHSNVRLSGNYQGRLEMRTHYGKIFIDEPEFEQIVGAVMSMPSASDRNAPPNGGSVNVFPSTAQLKLANTLHSGSVRTTAATTTSGATVSTTASSSSVSAHHQYSRPQLPPPQQHPQQKSLSTHGAVLASSRSSHHGTQMSGDELGASGVLSGPPSRSPSLTGSFDGKSKTGSATSSGPRSVSGHSTPAKTKEEKEKEKYEITKEVIGTIGTGSGLVMCKNSSGDIRFSLI